MSSSDRSSSIYRITFLRHAESVGNAEKRHQGQVDYPLTEKGRKQAQALATHWKAQEQNFDLILSSTLSRARETAEIIAAELEIEIETDPLWMERDNGELAGLLHEEAQEEVPQPDFIPLYQPIAETGESLWELYLRAGKAVTTLMERDPGSYLVVGHGGLFNMVMYALIGISPQPNFQAVDFQFDNCGFTSMIYHPWDSRWFLQGHNLTPHMD